MAEEQIREEYRDEEIELDLAGLLAYLIRHWKLLLIMMIAGMVLGGLASVVRYQLQRVSSGESAAVVIARAQSNLEREQDYLEHSILTNIDPYAEAYATANVMVEVDEEGFSLSIGGDNTISYSNTIASQIMQEYGRFLSTGVSYDSLTQSLGTRASYIQQTVGFSQNDTNGYFTISVRHYSEAAAETILDYVLEQVQNQRTSFGINVPRHTLTVKDKYVTTRTDSALLEAMDSDKAVISDDSFKNVYALAAEKRIKQLQSYISDRQTMIKKKYVLLGGLAGIFAGVFALSAYALFAGILLSGSFAESLIGSLVIISFPHTRGRRKRGWIDRLADNILGVSYGIADQQIYDMLAEFLFTRFLKEDLNEDETGSETRMRNVFNETGNLDAVRKAVKGMEMNRRRFLVVGDCLQPGEVKNLTTFLSKDDLPGMEFDYMERFWEGYESIDKVHEADYVILCVRIGKSSRMTLRKLLQVLKMYHKNVFGIVEYH
ncbi:MAG: hypothetical protein K6E92_09220 [Lachnospiraceae bacterium]|nr:hypothetical protein [Lachnospiraceae bacterium]